MNRFFSPKVLVTATLATAALGAATVAQARPDVYVSVGFQALPVLEPAPVYVQPRHVSVQPAPVYVRPPVFVSPGEVFEGARVGRHEARRDWERERAWRRAEWFRHESHEDFRGDRDHDRDDRKQRHDHRD